MSEKTEQATDAKLREAGLKGDVAKSSDFTAAVSSVFWFFLLNFGFVEAFILLVEWMSVFLRAVSAANDESLLLAVYKSVGGLLLIGLVIPLGSALLFIIAPEVAQTRGVLATKKELFSVQRVNPVSGLKQLFSLQRLTSIGFAIMRLGILAWVAYVVGTRLLGITPMMWGLPWFTQFAILGKHLIGLYGWAALFCLLLAFIDIFIQHKLWRRRNKMSKQDVRQEHKSQEGDPHMKGARQGLIQELASGN